MFRSSVVAVALGLCLLAGLEGSASPQPPAGFLDEFSWHAPGPLFGGWSGLRLGKDGASLTALSDHGAFVKAKILRDSQGRILRIMTGKVTPLKGNADQPLKPGRTDSEGLAFAPDGTAYVSFEGFARVLKYPRLDGPATNLPEHPDFAKMFSNASLETLAIDARGTLFTLPERSGAETRPFPVYRFRNGKWDQPFSIPRSGNYLAVDADFDSQGRFYLLERQFRGLAGFSTRLRRFELTERGFVNETLLLQTPVGLYDNLEGLSLWRDAQGTLIASMVSDNNFIFFLRTEIVEYRLPD